MTKRILARLLATLVVVAIVALFAFLMLRLAPGDPAAIMVGDNATPAELAAIRAQLGLDRSLPVSFLVWASGIVQGDWGTSFFSRVAVTELIGQRLEPTLMLALCATLVSVAVAVPAGIVAALHQGRGVDRVVMTLVVLGFSLPVFLIGYALVRVAAIETGWFPVQGYVSIFDDPGQALRHLLLPAVTVALPYASLTARMTRSAMIETLKQDYIRTARAKGLQPLAIVAIHALKNASPPIITTIGTGVAILLGGVVVTESVFAIPGLGRLTVDAVLRRDYPVIQGLLLLFSGLYFVVNLLVDLACTVADPRVRT